MFFFTFFILYIFLYIILNNLNIFIILIFYNYKYKYFYNYFFLSKQPNFNVQIKVIPCIIMLFYGNPSTMLLPSTLSALCVCGMLQVNIDRGHVCASTKHAQLQCGHHMCIYIYIYIYIYILTKTFFFSFKFAYFSISI